VFTRVIETGLWAKQRSSDWWDRVAVQFDDEEWCEKFQMSQVLFNHLCSELREHIEKQDTRSRSSVSVERGTITLWGLATKSDHRSTGHMFRVAKGTVCNATVQVLMNIKF